MKEIKKKCNAKIFVFYDDNISKKKIVVIKGNMKGGGFS